MLEELSKQLNELVASGKSTEALVRWSELDEEIDSVIEKCRGLENEITRLSNLVDSQEKRKAPWWYKILN